MEQQANETNTDELPSFPPSPASSEISPRTVTLGLLHAPEIAEEVARELASELPGHLFSQVDDLVQWEISVVHDSRLGSEQDASDILDICEEQIVQREWDYAISMTDLPMYRDRQIVVADASVSRRLGQISLPALGFIQIHRLTRQLAIQLVHEIYQRDRGSELFPNEPSPEPRQAQPLGGRLTRLLGPITRRTDPDQDMQNMEIDARFVETGVRGHLRLWSGMIYANHPFRLFTRFKGTIAAAFATGAYALISPPLWRLADAGGTFRLLLLMIGSFTAMVAWLIMGHNLWERSTDRHTRPLTVLYNVVTLSTLTLAVLFAYIVLFILLLLTELLVIPGSLLENTLQHQVGSGYHLVLAWVAASVATVAGALGSGLESDQTVRNAAFGYRQQQRNQRKNESGGEESE